MGERGPEEDAWRVEGLKDFRLKAGIGNQALLACRSGVTQQTISFLEVGKEGYMSAALAAKLAPILGVEDADLRLAHNLHVCQKKLDRGGMKPSATLYVVRRLLAMRPLATSPAQVREFESTLERLFEQLSKTV